MGKKLRRKGGQKSLDSVYLLQQGSVNSLTSLSYQVKRNDGKLHKITKTESYLSWSLT